MDRKSSVEIWKDIEGYPNYQVSNLGRVKSLERIDNNNHLVKEKILKSGINSRGYLSVALYKEGKQKSHLVHRLVATAFIDNPNNLLEVNHIDEDKTNNCVDNLEWCDRKYNTNYGTRTERTQKPILQFTKNGEFVRRWDSVIGVEKELGFNNGNISKCCKGKYKSVGGYVWMYANIGVFEIDVNKLKRAS